MKGCNPIADEDLVRILNVLNVRDGCILVLGVRTGFRISEILSINIPDVYRDGATLESIRLAKRNTKGKVEGRIMPMHSDVKTRIEALIATIKLDSIRLNRMHPNGIPLFLSIKGARLGRGDFHRNLKLACIKAGVSTSRIASHSMRKTFAKKFYEYTGYDVLKLQKALGHSRLTDTSAYIQVDQEEIWNAIKNAK